ncbi:hypothetical protein G6F46_002108 [Rhizopus delemar]|uniref:E2 ubiquitin-conjugating enzyme n=2 Tax=Rhizopus TaxID=4842 RepID=A0A9P6ZDS8_9FUNG|nr:hypothetical protein G6F55_009448 [Rhizopus delemar]KAG1551087.1 hypothetical protein G6F51_002064 [Rhizopus arrhizus]KAG1505007.1 hypothetical protein G6F54_000608 [Rhizopus delemar]KAG1516955.1 hypothetical protein G6F53_001765 [Rhizopus delemar]KAG1520908.1 hypothetical protein G6F52_007227 [Rhizopus delemar]
MNSEERHIPDEKDIEKPESISITTEEIVPPDGGRGWLVVLGSFMGMFAIFGYNYSWGVYLAYYKTEVYIGQMSTLSWIGSICVALFFIIGPFNQLIIERMGYKYMLATGTVCCTAALILASFAKEVWHVFLTQGVLFGLGASFVSFPCMGAPQQWFSKRRGLAVGITFAGSGVGGLVIANVSMAAIKSIGYRWALRIDGIIVFVLLSFSTCFVRPLGDVRRTGGGRKVINWYLFKNPMFSVMFMHGLITTFGYMTPYFLLPSHANALHLDAWVGANLSAIMSAVNAVSRVLIGYLGDKIGRFNSLFLFTFMCGVSCLVIWTNVHNEATLWAFAVIYGFCGGGYISMFPAVQPQVVGLEHIGPAIGLLYTTNIFGYLFGTPIASTLINLTTPATYLYGALWAGDLEKEPPPGITCYPKEDNITELEAYIKGPPDTPYEKGLFKLDIQIPLKYPFEPPQIRFKTLIYHPNIDDGGRICADILKTGGWKPALNLSTTLISLSQLLAHPNPDDPLDADIAKEYHLDYPQFKQKAIQYTEKYATREYVDDQEIKSTETVAQLVDKKENYNDKRNQTVVQSQSKLSLLLTKRKPSKKQSEEIETTQKDLSTVEDGAQEEQIYNNPILEVNQEDSIIKKSSQTSTQETLEKQETLQTQELHETQEGVSTSQPASLQSSQQQYQKQPPQKKDSTEDLKESNTNKATEKRGKQKRENKLKKTKKQEVAIVLDDSEEGEETYTEIDSVNNDTRMDNILSEDAEKENRVPSFGKTQEKTEKAGSKRPYSALELVKVIEISDDEQENTEQELFSEPILHSLKLSKKLSRSTLNLSKKKARK